MRTQEKFAKVWKDMQWFVKFHNKPVWIVPTDTNYAISVVPPSGYDLPYGTVSNLYDKDSNIIDSVTSTRSLF